MTRTEQINGYTISLEKVNGLHFIKITPGTMMFRGTRNKECSYIENNSQDVRYRVQQFKTYAKTNPLT